MSVAEKHTIERMREEAMSLPHANLGDEAFEIVGAISLLTMAVLEVADKLDSIHDAASTWSTTLDVDVNLTNPGDITRHFPRPQ